MQMAPEINARISLFGLISAGSLPLYMIFSKVFIETLRSTNIQAPNLKSNPGNVIYEARSMFLPIGLR